MQQHITHKTRSEYWADGIIHIIGVTMSFSAAMWLMFAALDQTTNALAIPLLAYCIGLATTFICSAAYNMTINPAPKAILRKFDRAAIFVMIAGTYTPLGLLGIGGKWGLMLVVANWVLATIGVIATIFFARRFERVSLGVYLFQGGLMLIAIGPMFEGLSLFAFAMILAGAFTYAFGVIFHRRDDWKYNRAIWHVFVLGAAIIHYAAILDIAKIA